MGLRLVEGLSFPDGVDEPEDGCAVERPSFWDGLTGAMLMSDKP